MKLPASAHTSLPWRIHEFASDLRVEDVWSLPTPGGPRDFPRLVAHLTSEEALERSTPGVVRLLFAIRWKLGELFRWDESRGDRDWAVPIEPRLSDELRATVVGRDFGKSPFTPLYLLENEFAAETINATVHGVLHLGWVPDDAGGFRGQLAILVKRNGLLGSAYMTAIGPVRHRIVYPLMLKGLGRAWSGGGKLHSVS